MTFVEFYEYETLSMTCISSGIGRSGNIRTEIPSKVLNPMHWDSRVRTELCYAQSYAMFICSN